jgi:Tol biopolymer transport system component
MFGRRACRVAIAIVLALVCAPAIGRAQYFGRNKVQYRTFSFQILQTEHFDFYYYPEEKEAAQLASRLAERWYARLSRFFDHQLRGRQVLILYAASSHFRQTNAVEGLIGEGTGGVTEALKRRIVLPMSGSLADTNHVIGHEIVHAFQFDITGTDPRDGVAGGGPGILQYPLWFVEGMAEYLSLGPVDAQTAMWMRDAAAQEKLPDIGDLEKPEYFPYRWGHSFWAFVGATYGDRAVASLVRSAANPRFDLTGLARQLGSDPAKLNADWHRAIRASAETASSDRPSLVSASRRLISHDSGGGRFNIGPRLSPDGRQIAFFSERDRFSIDLYLADAESGHIERKLIGSATDPHFDSLQFLNSAGAWTPDGKSLVLTALRSGTCVLAFIDPQSGRRQREIDLPGLDDAINPSISPDGRLAVLSGSHGGFVDLFLVSLDTGKLEPLTNDAYADLEPMFTPDGQSVVFVTERFTTDLVKLEPGPLRLARVNLGSRQVTPIAGFLQGKQISPQVSSDGKTLTFIAEPDGISNLYRMAIDGGPIEQISSFVTGVAGITASSPALSSASSGRLAFSVFEGNGDVVYLLDPANIVSTVAREAQGEAAGLPGRKSAAGDVERMVGDMQRGLPPATPTPPSVPYSRRLTLDMVGQPTVSAGISQFGGFVSGGMSAFFSDMLGDRALGVSGQVAGDLADFGGSIAYVNRRHRWNWAAVLEETPYRVDYLTASADDAMSKVTFSDLIERQTIRGVSGIAAFPFSPATRVEFSGAARALSFTRESKNANYAISGDTVAFVDQTTAQLPSTSSLYLAEATAAIVGDTSFYGATSPIYGRRYRFQMGESLGSLNYTTVLADWREYFMPKRPITLAFRAVHYGRYGADADSSRLVQLYAGYPELVHGYGLGSISPSDCSFVVGAFQCPLADDLVGSRLLVANAEVRAPLLGLFRGDLQYGALPIEVAAFMDAGVTWTKTTRPAFVGGTRDLFRSVGGAARINVFGLLIVEVAASRPLDRNNNGWQWQVGIREGF